MFHLLTRKFAFLFPFVNQWANRMIYVPFFIFWNAFAVLLVHFSPFRLPVRLFACFARTVDLTCRAVIVSRHFVLCCIDGTAIGRTSMFPWKWLCVRALPHTEPTRFSQQQQKEEIQIQCVWLWRAQWAHAKGYLYASPFDVVNDDIDFPSFFRRKPIWLTNLILIWVTRERRVLHELVAADSCVAATAVFRREFDVIAVLGCGAYDCGVFFFTKKTEDIQSKHGKVHYSFDSIVHRRYFFARFQCASIKCAHCLSIWTSGPWHCGCRLNYARFILPWPCSHTLSNARLCVSFWLCVSERVLCVCVCVCASPPNPWTDARCLEMS